ncbi:L-rhamnose-binding lectin SML-like [Xiphias gladius]|uniref:L-rhamnose-binding lectin SML-like n=1 Tax=Xiphias gladius TaxID=8245 RepID=UPI001A984A26|nr:L-rhamnose-binding lectin SML-like [Xiphias gladius]
MLAFRLSTTLLLATTCLLMKAVSTERVITCDDSHNVQRLSCADIGVISVQAALYGRADSETCSDRRPQEQLANIECSQKGTVDVLKRRCDGKRECVINTNVVRTSDPCYGIYKYLETNYTCFPAIQVVTCEHSVAHLYCDDGQVIFVYGADYGRRDQTTCSYRRPVSQTENVYCSDPTSKVANSCNGKNSCTIRVSNSVFGDPCVGTHKYLEVAYVCIYPEVIPQQLVYTD